MHPAKVLRLYYTASFIAGIILAFLLAHWVAAGEIGARGAAVMTACLNVLLIMLLPLVLDFSERSYFKARFLMLEELAQTYPELAQILRDQCTKLKIANLKLAIVHSSSQELFSYGLWRNNPRLVVPDSLIAIDQVSRMIPSIEAELFRFSIQDRTVLFVIFAAVQELLLVFLLVGHTIP
jgi:Zn-dependent protease with chaperone function